MARMIYTAFLRGINVGGHNRLKMDALRTLVASLGYEGVETYIQSGNLVFSADSPDEATIRRSIHDAIETEFGYDVAVIIRPRDELVDVVSSQPFAIRDDAGLKHYVTFLHESPTAEQEDALMAAQSDAESFVVSGRNIYSELDKDALGDGRFTDIGDTIGMTATRRTWNVVTSMLERS